jgi:hypothetical protein
MVNIAFKEPDSAFPLFRKKATKGK